MDRRRGEAQGITGLLESAKPHIGVLAGAALVAEVVAAAVGFADIVPFWAVSALVVGIPLGSWGFLQSRRARELERLFDDLFHFDRRYELFSSRWTLGPGTDGYLSGLHHGERRLVALTPVRYLTWKITPRSDDDIAYEGAEVRDRAANRSGAGECTFHPPHYKAGHLSFRIEFEPPLRIGESVEARFDVFVPRYKSATVEVLRTRPRSKVPPPGESEFSSTDIAFPIDRFVKEVLIPAELGTRHPGLQVLRRDREFREEAEAIERAGGFTAVQEVIEGRAVWRLRLERANPPIKTTYRLHWEPPG